MARSAKTGRTVHLRLTVPPGARAIGLVFAEPTAIRSATLDDQAWPAGERGSNDTQFRFFLLQAPALEAAATKKPGALDVVLAFDGSEVVEGRVLRALERSADDRAAGGRCPPEDGVAVTRRRLDVDLDLGEVLTEGKTVRSRA